MDDSRDKLNATIIRRIDVTAELVRLWVKPDVPHESFLAGQYMALGLPAEAPRINGEKDGALNHGGRLIKRTYSIASGPDRTDEFEFYLTVVPRGELTPRIAPLHPGDRIYTAPKIAGTFTLESIPGGCHLILVATGTGIAPYISMLRSDSIWEGGRRVTLIHGVRHPEELAYRDQISEMEGRLPVRFVPVVSRGTSSWTGIKGRVQQALFEGDLALDPFCQHVFLCGNPGMVDQVEEELVRRGFRLHSKRRPGNLHLEKYW